MTRRSWLATVSVLGLAGLLAACDSLPGTARRDPYADEQYPQIAVIENLSWDVVRGTPSVIMEPGQPLAVSVPIRSTVDHDLHVQYRFEFFDKYRRPLKPEMDWRYMQMPARAQVFFQGNALDTSAVDWRLIVRPTRG